MPQCFNTADANIVKIHKHIHNKKNNEENLDNDLSDSFRLMMEEEEEHANYQINPEINKQIENIAKTRAGAKTAIQKQADVMLKRQKKVINSFKVGDYVLYACSDVDRGSADPENLLCIILEHIPNSILFKLGCRAGKLDQSYPFNSLTKTDLVTDFKLEDIPDRIVSVRQAISTISIAGGQGVKKCSCKSGDCSKCSCKDNGQCNSKCHGGKPNPNCTRPGTGTVGLEDEEEVVSSQTTQSKQPLIKIGVTKQRSSQRKKKE